MYCPVLALCKHEWEFVALIQGREGKDFQGAVKGVNRNVMKNRGDRSRSNQALLVLPKIQCIDQKESPGFWGPLFTFGTSLYKGVAIVAQ